MVSFIKLQRLSGTEKIMANKIGKSWFCSYCNKQYKNQVDADNCRDEHGLVYIPLSQTDLNRLINFIYLKDDKLLSESLMRTLTRYLKGN